MKKILKAVYRLTQSPKFRYSFFLEGLRRYFLTYETREALMIKVMEWARFRNIEGDYLEFGVFKGNSFIKAYYMAKYGQLSSMKFYAFDSFSGYPPLEGVDKECGYFIEGDYNCDLKTFKRNLKKAGVPAERVVITEGLFEDLPKTARDLQTTASVVWIDCDLYKPTLEALNFLRNHITDGTVIVFADWLTCNGAEGICQPGAVQKWLEQNPDTRLVEFISNGGAKAFIVSRPPQVSASL